MRSTSYLLLAVIGIPLALPAAAQSPTAQSAAVQSSAQPSDPATIAERGGKVYDRLDKNHDGAVSLDEFVNRSERPISDQTKARREASFHRMDQNNDGTVSREEFLAAYERGAERRQARTAATPAPAPAATQTAASSAAPAHAGQ